ncbi:MAG: hypothetical protein NVV63_12500 [Opitutus sp.]|nr:hypothetical protein [Opitutus sp.]
MKEIALELGLTVEKVQSNVRYQFGWRRVLLSPEEQALIAERRAAKT